MGKYRTGIYVLIYLQCLCTDQGMCKTCGRLLDSMCELSDSESKHVWMWLHEVKYGSWQVLNPDSIDLQSSTPYVCGITWSTLGPSESQPALTSTTSWERSTTSKFPGSDHCRCVCQRWEREDGLVTWHQEEGKSLIWTKFRPNWTQPANGDLWQLA